MTDGHEKNIEQNDTSRASAPAPDAVHPPATISHPSSIPPLPRGDINQNPPGMSLWQLIREDLRTHNNRILQQGFLVLALHRFANWRMSIRPRLLRAPFSLLYHLLYPFTEYLCGIKLSYNVKVGRRVRIEHFGGMVLGARSIGDDCVLRQNTTLGVVRPDQLEGKPIIEDRVDIGAGACLLGHITIGHDSIIGANAVVVRDVPPCSVVVGVPGRVIKTRTPEGQGPGARGQGEENSAMASSHASRLGIVTIGRNEGERLRRGLEALRRLLPVGTPVVYVDSGSTDGSVGLARSLDAHVVELDMSVPFTMARGRNAGYDYLRQMHPDVNVIQFIDGDCELLPGWIEEGLRTLQENPRLAVVSGRRRERFPEASIYNQLADMEWDTPVGEVKACHGDAMIRVEALEQVGSFNAAMIAGEEPELCVRLRAAGWRIHRLDVDMTLHDAAMTRFSQWWNRCVRGGWAYAEGAAMHGAPPERHNVRQSRSVWFWGLLLPLAALLLAWPTGGYSLLAMLAYPLLFVRIMRHRIQRDDTARKAMLYAGFNVLAKFPQLVGQIRYHLHRRRGTPARLIEYKPSEGVSCS